MVLDGHVTTFTDAYIVITANATTEDRPIALRLAVVEVRGTTTPVRMTRRARMMINIPGLVVHQETKVVTANVDL